MPDVKVPGGHVPRSVIFIGLGVAGVGAYLWHKHRQAQAQDTGGSDYGYGQYGYGQYAPSDGYYGYGYGYGQYGTQGFGGGGYYPYPPVPSTPVPAGITTNSQWVNSAVKRLTSFGVNRNAALAALSRYVEALPLTPHQQHLTELAIGIRGYPPVSGPDGFPPKWHAQHSPRRRTDHHPAQ